MFYSSEKNKAYKAHDSTRKIIEDDRKGKFLIEMQYG